VKRGGAFGFRGRKTGLQKSMGLEELVVVWDVRKKDRWPLLPQFARFSNVIGDFLFVVFGTKAHFFGRYDRALVLKAKFLRVFEIKNISVDKLTTKDHPVFPARVSKIWFLRSSGIENTGE
jgi:hypothetical protein